MSFIRNALILAAGVFLAAMIVPGIEFGSRWDSLLLVVVLLALFNAILKPLLVLFTLPFIVLSMGLGLWIINALLLFWSAKLVDGFEVKSFWSALAGAFVISFTSMLLSGHSRRMHNRAAGGPAAGKPERHRDGGEIIDVE
ncbi:MAG TPA: phage holin family protein [Opitutales bacterium]|mgnify:CR=1 FL=1|nr:phage holin family protein [Opitutales bacterium]